LVFIVRCSEPVHECGNDVDCANAGALAGKVPPVAPRLSETGSSTADAGSGWTSLCAPIVNPDGGGCKVSFTKDILQSKLGAGPGTWGCAASGCHDPKGGIAPQIDVLHADITYANLFHSGALNPYVNPCSTDPNKSDILHNLGGTDAGDHMPKSQPGVPSQSELDQIIAPWVLCGSPLN